ncbi:MAG: nucleoside monophosphate kinase [Candidatus Liptonbacteria bacterium]|nr:nucleoside monophosphate kinase [Candidatus Liptonbacteria bacterium]
MRKIVVVLYGPPGSGKGTQANLLEKKFDLIHFDTGRFLEAVVHDPKRQDEALVKRERKFFDGGQLMTPSFVLGEVSREARRIHKADFGIVFSGSPRTLYEAKALYPILEKLYGKKNIFIFELKLPPGHSISRNSSRLMCTVCGYGLLTAYYPRVKAKHCPVCGGPFYRRTLDKPEVIKIRLREYETRTKPILSMVKKYGYKVRVIDALPAPYKILAKIASFIKK